MHYVGGDKLAAGGEKEGGEASPRRRPRSPTPRGRCQGGKERQAQITKIEAKGEVVITSDKDQTTTSDWALYDVPAQLVTVGGNVVLTQGQNVLKGDRLVIDLKTGESRFDNTGNAAAGGRIRALFMPKDAPRAAIGRRQAGRRQAWRAAVGDAEPATSPIQVRATRPNPADLRRGALAAHSGHAALSLPSEMLTGRRFN